MADFWFRPPKQIWAQIKKKIIGVIISRFLFCDRVYFIFT